MQPEVTTTGTPEELGGEAAAKQEPRILTSVKVVAQRITERVQKALADTGTYASLPTEENPPLP